jgi:hypothetical protein
MSAGARISQIVMIAGIAVIYIGLAAGALGFLSAKSVSLVSLIGFAVGGTAALSFFFVGLRKFHRTH